MFLSILIHILPGLFHTPFLCCQGLVLMALWPSVAEIKREVGNCYNKFQYYCGCRWLETNTDSVHYLCDTTHQLERKPILSKVFAPVRENDITKAKTFQCLGKRTSLKMFLQWDIMNLYHSEEEFSQTVLKFEVPKETFILPWFKRVAKYLQFNRYSFPWYLIVWTLHLYAK